jgi:hypothetical protein
MPEHGRDLSAPRFAQSGAKLGHWAKELSSGECGSPRSPPARTVTAATTHSAQLLTVSARGKHGTRSFRAFERTAVVRRIHTGCATAHRKGSDPNALSTRRQLRHRRCRRGNHLCRAEPGRTVILEFDDDDDTDDIHHEQRPGTSATYGLLIDVLTGSLHTRWRCLAQVRAGRHVRRQLNAVSPARPYRP